jgi:hypothetical protein
MAKRRQFSKTELLQLCSTLRRPKGNGFGKLTNIVSYCWQKKYFYTLHWCEMISLTCIQLSL